MAIEVGQEAPDFELRQGFDTVKLSEFRDKENVVLVFYPFTFTGVCRAQENGAEYEKGIEQVIRSQRLPVREARMLRSRLISSGSAPASPSAQATAIGKKQYSVTTMIFGPISKPNQMSNKGASAMIGMV